MKSIGPTFCLLVLILCIASSGISGEALFKSGFKTGEIPFEDDNNLIFVQGSINGSDPLWIILDTGAAMNMVDIGVAEKLKLDLSRKTRSEKSGLEYVELRDLKLSFPGVEFRGLSAGAMSLEELGMVAGREIAAIFGYYVIEQAVFRIDYQGRTVSFFDFDHFQYQGKGETIPLTIVANWPWIEVMLSQKGSEPVTAKLLLDSGSLMAVSLVRDLGIARETVEEPLSFGIAGAGGGARIGRIAEVSIKGFTLREVTAGLSSTNPAELDPIGKAIAENGAGLIGAEVMRRFQMIFDYSRKKLIVEPNAALKEPFEADMGGMFLLQAPQGAGFMAYKVGSGSAAERAGVRDGDVITAVNGKKASEITLSDFRALLMKDGTTLNISVRRGQEQLELKLQLKRRI